MTVEDRAEKLALFRAGRYFFRAPATCTAGWDDDDWLVYLFGHQPLREERLDEARQVLASEAGQK